MNYSRVGNKWDVLVHSTLIANMANMYNSEFDYICLHFYRIR